ncbi:bifunctional hydroxymethylpyrimidine kinase/phosphomethylpyrimidine kinase [Stackebrandtia nassauensis]|uniref:Phosphomethylpyrimidine kinase n=1 Tax=Stackebrandtia nassauensis (strain DSM 44728 / CIP 108903 / NRRL B-16338 / NBRC 102104 / LLR-40K-21) TaxID=446470 RepID=D3Q917_STANL|nr:bifunctional hydroxymethylpyrimidine kinase/phosphomethylpyrimidine kinase [Stackebrandtia nassauensis]ADD40626.1 phosphomethylpyrimidine kinase [Stackebrandtia nassauensis DSM 44728]
MTTVTTQPPTALTIAGSDSGGGAGIQADLHTFAAHAVHGTSVVTSVTAQNTLGVTDVHPVPPETVSAQLDAVLSDFDVRAVKTGLLPDETILSIVAERAEAGDLPELVVDPVLVAASGDKLFTGDFGAYLERLSPHTIVFTPNIHEAQALLGGEITGLDDMREAARALARYGSQAVLVKGGHGKDPEKATDVLWTQGQILELSAPRVDTPNTHGTGCTLASAIAARIAHGHPVAQAVGGAKRYLTEALTAAASWRLGAGPGPVHHHHGRKSTVL